MRVFVLFLSFLCVSKASSQPQITTSATLTNLHVYNEDGMTYVDHLPDYCDSQRFVLLPSHAKYDAILSILLAAQISKKAVRLRFDGCLNNGLQGKIVGVYLSE